MPTFVFTPEDGPYVVGDGSSIAFGSGVYALATFASVPADTYDVTLDVLPDRGSVRFNVNGATQGNIYSTTVAQGARQTVNTGQFVSTVADDLTITIESDRADGAGFLYSATLAGLTQILNLGAPWTSSTVVQSPTFVVTLQAPPWSPNANVFAPVVAGPLGIGARVDSTATVFTPGINRFVDLSIAPFYGSTAGGTQLLFSGSSLDMSTCTPNFTDGVLDAGFWTDLSSGTGEVLESGATQSLRLNTGQTAGSVAGVRTVGLAGDLDVEVQASVLTTSTGVLSDFELGLYVDANTDLRLIVAGGVVTLVTREGGQTTGNVAVGTTAGGPQLRLLRVGARVWVFLGQSLITVANWVSTSCNIELRARNNATTDAQVATRVNKYVRRPLVRIDQQPILDLSPQSNTQAVGTLPARTLPGLVDVQVTGCSTATDTISSGFTYVLDPNRPIVLAGPNGGQLTVITDPILKGRLGR